MTLALHYLNKKIKDTENDKLSLVTASKISNEEQHCLSRGHSSPDILDEPEIFVREVQFSNSSENI